MTGHQGPLSGIEVRDRCPYCPGERLVPRHMLELHIQERHATEDAALPGLHPLAAVIARTLRSTPVPPHLPEGLVARLAVAVAVYLDKQTSGDAPHRYLSTGCLHGEHGYCQSSTGSNGTKVPATCKFCAAPCECPCHQASDLPREGGVA
ncbi:hypothetical protein ACH4FX_12185 [Streptomyces sp. NPDC018019]|uniref:hypothetical protein n=1 Tax=Streptomyces sp. NPDC018019 TaxID=3365030 RepID=UPI0037B8A964